MIFDQEEGENSDLRTLNSSGNKAALTELERMIHQTILTPTIPIKPLVESERITH